MLDAPSWSDYKNWLEDNLIALPKDLPAPAPQAFATDSRSIQKGQWYLALVGENADGHQYIAEACQKGASGFVAAIDHVKNPVNKENGIWVKDTSKALKQIAKGQRLRHKATVIAMTGSVGKTTCKEILAHLLKGQGEVLSSPGNFNNEVGLPLTLLKLEAKHQYVVLEMGARSPGDIKTLMGIASPDAVIFLNAKESHLEIFKDKESLLKTKLEIINDSKKGCKVSCFGDDKRIDYAMLREGRDLLTFGFGDVDVKISEVLWQGQNIQFKLSHAGENCLFELPNAHSAYPVNFAASAAILLALGIPFQALKSQARTFQGAKRRFESYHLGELLLIDDCYNASPSSMEAGFQTLKARYPNEETTLVLGDMLELGDSWQSAHETMGTLCQTMVHPTKLITVGEKSRFLREAAIAAGLAQEKAWHFPSVKELILAKESVLPHKGLVYVKGSNSIKLSSLIESIVK